MNSDPERFISESFNSILVPFLRGTDSEQKESRMIR